MSEQDGYPPSRVRVYRVKLGAVHHVPFQGGNWTQSLLALLAVGPEDCQRPPPIYGPMASVMLRPTLALSLWILGRIDLLSCIVVNENVFSSDGNVDRVRDTRATSASEE
mgnify:CR=1 FL=1